MSRSRAPIQHIDTGGAALPNKQKQRIESLVNSGKLGQARKVADRLCRRFPDNPEAWFLLGAVCGSQGDYAHAVECCKRTTQLAPDVAIGHFNLGVALHKAGRTRDAVAPLRKAMQLQPMMLDIYRELGGVFAALGDYDQALKTLSVLVRFQPDDTIAWIALGNLYEKLANLPEAERCYRKAEETDPRSIAARMNLGNVLKSEKKTDEAEQCYLALLKEMPDNFDVIYNLAVLYQSNCRYADAEIRYREVLNIRPDHRASLNNLGLILMAQSLLDEAEAVFVTLLQDKMDDFEVARNLSAVFKEQNRLDLADKQLNTILTIDPEYAPAHKDRSLVWLQQGMFDKGWDEYEWRNSGVNVSDRWPYPTWDGIGSEDVFILVFPEQGIGDEIMFSSCIDDLARIAGRVVLACDERLEPLFKRSFPAVSVLGRSTTTQDVKWLNKLPHIDAQVSIASLPKYFRRHIKEFPEARCGYLKADPCALKKWKSRYDLLGPGLKVGLSWRGGHVSNTQLKRSIALQQMSDVLGLSNVHFINVQYGDCAEEIEDVRSRYGVSIHDWENSDPLMDMDDFAAQVGALDLVLTIDNSTAHLSGALGVKTWILQPFSPDWRWLPEQENSYWYPSVKQYRQAVPGQWDDVLFRVTEALVYLMNSIRD